MNASRRLSPPSPSLHAAGLLAAGSEGVQLDSLLHGALYNKKEPQKTGNTVPLKDVLARMIDKLQLYHHLAREVSCWLPVLLHSLRPALLRMLRVVGWRWLAEYCWQLVSPASPGQGLARGG